MEKVICYANLNCFNSPDNVTDEHMQKFFIEALSKIPNKPALELVDIVIDRYTPNVHYMRREGWQKVLNTCKEEKVDFVVIPSISMVTKGIVDMVHFFNYMKESYSCEVCLMYEKIASSDKEADNCLSFFITTEEYKEQLKKAERKLRGHFYDATQINREISAVPVLIDNKIYEKAEKFAHDYGADLQSVLNWFFEQIVEAKNHEIFEKIMGWEDVE